MVLSKQKLPEMSLVSVGTIDRIMAGKYTEFRYSSIQPFLSAPIEKKPFVKGCRRYGKTYSVLKFAEENYERTVNINFFENPSYIL